MELQRQIEFLEEHSREARFRASDPSYKGDKFKAEDDADALTAARDSLKQLLALQKALAPLVKPRIEVSVLE